MKRVLSILASFIFFISMILVQSCNDVCSCKQVPCPGYNNINFDEWFPYDSAQQIIYTDSLALHSDTATILGVSTRAPYDAKKGCNSANNGCSSNKYIYSNFLSFSYNSSSDWNGALIDSTYSVNVHDFSAQAKILKTTGFDSLNMPSAFYSEIKLNGKAYHNVQVITRTDTIKINEGVYKIFIQKITGLLAYQYYPSHTLLVKK